MIHEIDVDELADHLATGRPLIDVRNPDEYVEGHVPGAVLIPLPEVPDRLAEFPSPVDVICRSGARSLRACEFLAAHDIDATNVVGGMLAWLASGRDAVIGAEPG